MTVTISKFIRDDLVARMFANSEKDETLTLGGIASHYSVSTTPVRAAVQSLIDDGILQKGPNRRLKINRDCLNDWVAASAESSAQETKSTESLNTDSLQGHVQEISDYLVGLCLEGEPIFLREVSTAKLFGITRPAVRQVFAGLAGHGMIEHIPRRGWQIRPLREEDLDEYIEVRIPLESLALKLARPHLVDDDVRKILDGNRLPNTVLDEPTIDDSLHRYIIQKAGNHYLADFFDRNSKYFSLLFNWEVLDRETRIQTVRQHREILEAILCKDWPLAESALQFHIQHNHPLLRKRIRDRASKR